MSGAGVGLTDIVPVVSGTFTAHHEGVGFNDLECDGDGVTDSNVYVCSNGPVCDVLCVRVSDVIRVSDQAVFVFVRQAVGNTGTE
ncbi:MAG: hypothetical protein ACJAZO_003025 [Myxococcota bacterium]|jgi:hypothetical protein